MCTNQLEYVTYRHFPEKGGDVWIITVYELLEILRYILK